MRLHIVGEIQVDRIQRSSGVFAGDNRQSGWSSAAVDNQAATAAQGQGNRIQGLRSVLVSQHVPGKKV